MTTVSQQMDKRHEISNGLNKIFEMGPVLSCRDKNTHLLFRKLCDMHESTPMKSSYDLWFISLFCTDKFIDYYAQYLSIVKIFAVKFPRHRLISSYLAINRMLWTMTSISEILAQKLANDEVISGLINLLSLSKLDLLQCHNENNVRLLVHTTVGILYNTIRHCCMKRFVYREKGAVNALFRFVHSDPIENLAYRLNHRIIGKDIQLLSLRTACLLLLTFIIERNENHYIRASDDHIIYMLIALQDALNNTGNLYSMSFGYDANELLQGFFRLATVEQNASIFLHNEAMNLIKDTLKAAIRAKTDPTLKNLSYDPNYLAYTTLSFLLNLCRDERIDVYTSDSEFLRLINSFNNRDWSQACRNLSELILHILDKEKNRMTEHLDSLKKMMARGRKCTLPNGHVMIAYRRHHKTLINALKQELEKSGFCVQITPYDEFDNCFDFNAKLIDDASLVIAALCPEFENCQYCCNQMRYAFRIEKIIIPLFIGPVFETSSWLRMIWPSDDVNSLSDISEVSMMASILTPKLEALGVLRSSNKLNVSRFGLKNKRPISPSNPPFPSNPSNANSLGDVPSIIQQKDANLSLNDKFENWSAKHVSLWLVYHGLEKYRKKWSVVDGNLLAQMVHMYQNSLEDLSISLEVDSKMTLKDRLRLFKGLNQLSISSNQTSS